MIEEYVPFSYIDRIIEHLERELEYELYEDEDRKETFRLSAKIDALKELKGLWLHHDR